MSRPPKSIPLAELASPNNSQPRKRIMPAARPAVKIEPAVASDSMPSKSVPQENVLAMPPIVLRIFNLHPAKEAKSVVAERWKQGLHLIDERRKMLVSVTIGLVVLGILMWRGGSTAKSPMQPAAKPKTILEWAAPQSPALPTMPPATTVTTNPVPPAAPEYRTADRGSNLTEQARQETNTVPQAPVWLDGTIEKQPFDTSYERPRSSPN